MRDVPANAQLNELALEPAPAVDRVSSYRLGHSSTPAGPEFYRRAANAPGCDAGGQKDVRVDDQFVGDGLQDDLLGQSPKHMLTPPRSLHRSESRRVYFCTVHLTGSLRGNDAESTESLPTALIVAVRWRTRKAHTRCNARIACWSRALYTIKHRFRIVSVMVRCTEQVSSSC